MLDFTTVFVFSTGICVFVCLVTGLAWLFDETGAETRNWFIASVLQVSGTFLMISGDFIPLQIGGYIGGIVSTAASGYLALGYRQLYGEDARPTAALVVAFLTGTAVYATKLLSGGHQDGIWLLYLGGSINLIVAARVTCRGSRREKLRFGRIAAFTLVVYAATYVAIAPLAYFYPVQFVDGKPVTIWLEVTTIPLVLLNMAAYLMTLVVKLERATERQRHLARHDGLTGALNRTAFYDAWSRRAGHGGVLAVLDIDHFKSVNDTFGHHAGDTALGVFCRAVTDALPKGAVFGRLGGEEFAILLTDCGPEEVRRLLDDLRTVVSATSIAARDGRRFSITFSGGYVGFDAGESDMDRIFAAADRALYTAKNTGRDRIVAFDAGLLLRQDARQLRTNAALGTGVAHASA
ncbi:GGDEF domain-containing protein [Rhizobium sp. C4]|uniref:GGDEF domain-containing protein n=1 Tax=Rhizobium sp. C4 TaxID=1349800 RepID=UPI001E3408CB|nr:GGDEF domain-containing protein [Rhizobium sp. C4]MCD2172869.1 GGDEF domain-containing protein [Rhizobium sp. C4]